LNAFLNEQRLAHLATSSKSGWPRVSPIWYLYENGFFYFTTRLGRVKGRHIQKNRRVALSIATDDRPYRAVCALGTAEIVKATRNKWMKKIAFRYGAPEGKRWLARAVKQPDRVVMVMKPERVLSWDYGRGDSLRQDNGQSMITAI
jgi:PPOX class probable F420-dependent enzyme